MCCRKITKHHAPPPKQAPLKRLPQTWSAAQNQSWQFSCHRRTTSPSTQGDWDVTTVSFNTPSSKLNCVCSNFGRTLISDKFPLFEIFGGTFQRKLVVFAPHIEQLLYHKYTKFWAPSSNWCNLPKLQTPTGTVKCFQLPFYKGSGYRSGNRTRFAGL